MNKNNYPTGNAEVPTNWRERTYGGERVNYFLLEIEEPVETPKQAAIRKQVEAARYRAGKSQND